MKRFLLFAGDDFYPSGGWDDFVGDFDSAAEAEAAAPAERRSDNTLETMNWWHIVDSESGKVCKRSPYMALLL